MSDGSPLKLELHSLLLCDHAITSQDGKVSAIGIFSQLSVQRLPTVTGRFFIVAILEADAGAHDLTLQVIGPDGGEVLARPPRLAMRVPPNTTSANIVADLKGLQIRQMGRHRIELRAGERVLGSTPLNINFILQQPKPATA